MRTVCPTPGHNGARFKYQTIFIAPSKLKIASRNQISRFVAFIYLSSMLSQFSGAFLRSPFLYITHHPSSIGVVPLQTGVRVFGLLILFTTDWQTRTTESTNAIQRQSKQVSILFFNNRIWSLTPHSLNRSHDLCLLPLARLAFRADPFAPAAPSQSCAPADPSHSYHGEVV